MSHQEKAPLSSTLRFQRRPAGRGQVFLVASCLAPAEASEAAIEAYRRVAAALHQTGTRIVHERVFASLGARSAILSARKRCLEQAEIDPAGPLTYIEGKPPWGEGLAGVLIRAVGPVEPGDDVWPLTDAGTPVGRGWRRCGAEFLVLQNVQGLPAEAGDEKAPTFQAGRAIDRAERLLHQNGTSYRSVIRTWFYLDHILDWYDAFNEVRSARYADLGLLSASGEGTLLPASTGVGGRAADPAAVTLDLIAAAGPQPQRLRAHRLTNPQQQEALRYGAAFSRGVLVREPDAAVLQVSGTAAVDEAGRSVQPDDVRAQIRCTFDNLEALLIQAGASLADICAATVFVRRPEFAAHFHALAAERGLTDFPGVCVVADICRPDLLFEIDAEAAVAPARVPSSLLSL